MPGSFRNTQQCLSLSQNSSSNLFELLELSLVVLLRKTSDILNVSCLDPKEKIPLAFSASSRGRPAYLITKEMIEQLRETSLNWISIGTCLGISNHRQPQLQL